MSGAALIEQWAHIEQMTEELARLMQKKDWDNLASLQTKHQAALEHFFTHNEISALESQAWLARLNAVIGQLQQVATSCGLERTQLLNESQSASKTKKAHMAYQSAGNNLAKV